MGHKAGNDIVVWLFLVVSLLCSSCQHKAQEQKEAKAAEEESPLPQEETTTDNSSRVTVMQGLWGDVFMQNYKDLSDGDDAVLEPISADIVVYELTTTKQVTLERGIGGTIISGLKTRQVAQVKSDSAGFYQAALPPGKYSVFIKRQGRYIANHVSTTGELSSVLVPKGSVRYFRVVLLY